MNTFQSILLFIAFYDIFYVCLYYRPVDRELSRNFLVDRSRRQVGHPCSRDNHGNKCAQSWFAQAAWFFSFKLKILHWSVI